MKFFILINVKMPYTISELVKAKKVLVFQHFSFYERLKFHAQLSWACSFITLESDLIPCPIE